MSQRAVDFIQIPAADRRRAAAFYGALFGWRAEHDEEARYSRFFTPGVPGGWAPVHPQRNPVGYVLPHVTSADIDADLRRAAALGATVVRRRTEIPHVGWFGILHDPSGNPLALFTGAGAPGDLPAVPRVPGSPVFLVLPAHERRALADFYRQLLGWGPFTHHDALAFSSCRTATLGIGINPLADRLNRPGEILLHVQSEDIAADLARAAALGGAILRARAPIPGVGAIGLLSDPTGNRLVLLEGGFA